MSACPTQNETIQNPRNICDVITTIVMGVIPITEEKLLASLIQIHRDALYTPPECQRMYWISLMIILNDSIEDPIVGWKKTLQDIINAKNSI